MRSTGRTGSTLRSFIPQRFGLPPHTIVRKAASLLTKFRKRGFLLSVNLGDRRIMSDRDAVASAGTHVQVADGEPLAGLALQQVLMGRYSLQLARAALDDMPVGAVVKDQ